MCEPRSIENKRTAKRLAMRFEYVAGAEGLEPSTYGFGVRVILFSVFVRRYENWRY